MRFEIGEVRFEAGGGKAKKILRTAFPAWVFRTYLRSVFFSKLTSHYLASNFIFVKFFNRKSRFPFIIVPVTRLHGPLKQKFTKSSRFQLSIKYNTKKQSFK